MKYDLITKVLENKLILYSKELNKKTDQISIIIAVSGGVDSIVLSHIFCYFRLKYKIKLYFVHFNHRTSKNSDKMVLCCKSFASIKNVNIIIKKIYFNNISNFESRARKKRYSILARLSKKLNIDLIMTAHHKNDQIETLYMKQNDGADWISKIGIRERFNNIRRPMLSISKNQIYNFAKNNNLHWVEDETNKNMSFRRNKLRYMVIPNIKTNITNKLLVDAEINSKKMDALLMYFNYNIKTYIIERSRYYAKIDIRQIKCFNLEEIKIFIYFIINKTFKINIESKSRGLWKEFIKYLKTSKTGSRFSISDIHFFINRDKEQIIMSYSELFNYPVKKKIGLS